jgi:hypothetical protein
MFREDTILMQTEQSMLIKENYKKFLTTNTKPYAGYCLQQTKKYGVKGSRYGTIKQVLDLCAEDYTKTKDFYDANKKELIKIDFVEYVADEIGAEYLSVLGRKYNFKAPFSNTKLAWVKIEEEYGVRSKKASEESGYDAKAISHAYRVIKQLQELLTTEFIAFPLKDVEYIKRIKSSDVDFQEVLELVESEMNALDELVKNSKLSSTINQDFLDEMLLRLV